LARIEAWAELNLVSCVLRVFVLEYECRCDGSAPLSPANHGGALDRYSFIGFDESIFETE
jgi:hypothetical protein